MTKKRAKHENDEPVDDSAIVTEVTAEVIPELSPSTSEDRITAVEAEKVEIHDRMLRIAADFDNWKKRAHRDQAESELRAKESLLRDFLEIVDGLERATASGIDGKESDAKSFREGVTLVLRKFLKKLDGYDVKPMVAVGALFDPRIHEAVSQVPSATVTPGYVMQELQKGYLLDGKLLRPALVVVAAAPSNS